MSRLHKRKTLMAAATAPLLAWLLTACGQTGPLIHPNAQQKVPSTGAESAPEMAPAAEDEDPAAANQQSTSSPAS